MQIKRAEKAEYAQLNQELPVKFSYANLDGDTVTQLHDYVICRDFLGDVVSGKKFTIYSFNSDIPHNKEELQLLVKFPNAKVKKFFVENLERIIHPIEKEHGLALTEYLHKKDTRSNEYLIIADKFWMSKVFLISLYSYLIKACCYGYENPDNWMTELSLKPTTEGRYLRSSTQSNRDIDRLKFGITNLRKLVESNESKTGWDESVDDSALHSRIHGASGFHSIMLCCDIYKNNVFAANFRSMLK